VTPPGTPAVQAGQNSVPLLKQAFVRHSRDGCGRWVETKTNKKPPSIVYAVARYQMCLVLLWLEEESTRKEVPRGSKEAQVRLEKSQPG